MTLANVSAAVRGFLDAPFAFWARAVWCRKQQQRLARPGHGVVWVRGDTLPWARWGAERGYFVVQQMDGLSYLSATAAPA